MVRKAVVHTTIEKMTIREMQRFEDKMEVNVVKRETMLAYGKRGHHVKMKFKDADHGR